LVWCCGDGDVVAVGEGDGGDFGEGRTEKKVDGVLDANLQMSRKWLFRTLTPRRGEANRRRPASIMFV